MITQPPGDPHVIGSPVEAVLLDAFGTLVTLDDPAGRLGTLLADAGHPHPPDAVARALRAEVRHYRAHHDEACDPDSLAGLRRDCARVLGDALGGDVPPIGRLTGILVASLRFTLLPDAVPALDVLAATGAALAVVSNWDCGLGEVLDELGVAHRFAAVSVSAVVGAAKPDPAIFHDALGRLGVAPARALHCGDVPAADCAGASRAGVRGVLVDRSGVLAGGPCPRIADLRDLVRFCKT